MVLINCLGKSILSLLCLCLISSCHKSIPDKIDAFINNNHLFSKSDTCIINLSDVLNIEYDTMYLFNSVIPLSGLNDIIGRESSEDTYNQLAFIDSEDIYVYFKKNEKIVLEDRFSKKSHLEFNLDSFKKQYKTTLFDGDSIEVFGYYSSNNKFRVINLKDYSILLGN